MNEKITEFLKSRLVSDIGFSRCEDSPFPKLDNAVSIVMHLSEAVVNGIEDAPTHTYFHHYRTMNAYIDSVTNCLVLYLQELGFTAAAIPSSQSINGLQGLYSHKKCAVRAGLGQIGKSALFLSYKFGRVFGSERFSRTRRLKRNAARRRIFAERAISARGNAALWR